MSKYTVTIQKIDENHQEMGDYITRNCESLKDVRTEALADHLHIDCWGQMITVRDANDNTVAVAIKRAYSNRIYKFFEGKF